MSAKNARQNAILRLVSGNGTKVAAGRYSLLSSREMVMGRDPSCQVVLDSMIFRTVSRRHALVRPLASSADGENVWVLCDMDSANGTYLNGRRLKECQQLVPGDRISLGLDGPMFVFEYEQNPLPTVMTPGVTPIPPVTSYKTPHSRLDSKSDKVSFTQLFPIFSTGKDLTNKAYLVPGIVTVTFVVLMFATVGKPEANQVVVASYIALAAYYFVYRLCGKHKPWWVLIAAGLTTALILLSPILDVFFYVFRQVLPGEVDLQNNTYSATDLLMRMFFGAGLMEELLKALPILAAFIIAHGFPSPWRERIGVFEPLDGILLGTASAIGFTLLETLGQYVPQITRDVSIQVGAQAAGDLAGFQLLIARVLGSPAGHMAYSGYLGYFIGLAVLKPRSSWRILSVGYLTASVLHALWNTVGVYNGWLLVIVGGFSYAFLMAAILKARALSPTRAQNFATRFFDPK